MAEPASSVLFISLLPAITSTPIPPVPKIYHGTWNLASAVEFSVEYNLTLRNWVAEKPEIKVLADWELQEHIENGQKASLKS